MSTVHHGASQKAGLNTRLHDAGWRHVRSILAVTAACAGTRVDAVPPASTSQDCSGCGQRMQLCVSVRTHVYTHCGVILDRDEHAARTSLWRGQRLRGVAGLPAALNREPVGL
jgi:putative transposase